MKKMLFVFLPLLASCSYSITMVHTEGEASDVIKQSQTPTSDATANIDMPISTAPASVTNSDFQGDNTESHSADKNVDASLFR